MQDKRAVKFKRKLQHTTNCNKMKLKLTVKYIVPFKYLGVVASTSEKEVTYPLGCPIILFLQQMEMIEPHTSPQDIEIRRKDFNRTRVEAEAPLFLLQTDADVTVKEKKIEVEFRYPRIFHRSSFFGLLCSVQEDEELSFTREGIAPVVPPTLTVCYQLKNDVVTFLNHYPPLVLEDHGLILSDVLSRLLGNRQKISCPEDLWELSNVSTFSANGTTFRVNFILKQNNMKKQNMVYLSSPRRHDKRYTEKYTLIQ